MRGVSFSSVLLVWALIQIFLQKYGLGALRSNIAPACCLLDFIIHIHFHQRIYTYIFFSLFAMKQNGLEYTLAMVESAFPGFVWSVAQNSANKVTDWRQQQEQEQEHKYLHIRRNRNCRRRRVEKERAGGKPHGIIYQSKRLAALFVDRELE